MNMYCHMAGARPGRVNSCSAARALKGVYYDYYFGFYSDVSSYNVSYEIFFKKDQL